jgi:hypothetical protein
MPPNPPKPEKPPAASALKAVLVGQAVVNLPVIAIILIAFSVGGMLLPQQPWISLVAGVILGWAWWSLAIRRWRAWALSKGVPPAELTRMAAFSGLARPGDWYELEEDEIDQKSNRI